MFGRRKREEEAAAEAAREAERHALFVKLAERPEHICPFLGLEGERTGYVEGVSAEHRCFAFGDPSPLSAEQQTRVCQERGYGNCPRYLRGVLVIPTEELEALRRPRAPLPEPVAPPPEEPRRRRAPILALFAVLVLLVAAGGAYLAFGDRFFAAAVPSTSPSPTEQPTPLPTAEPTAEPTEEPTAEATPRPTPTPIPSGAPTPEPTPEFGDEFAFYEVAVSPGNYTLYELDGDNNPVDTRGTSFDGFSFAQADPVRGGDGEVYWVTATGGLTGFAYRYPDSGDFQIRAVFLDDTGSRRSAYLETEELTAFPEATPAP